jgi:glycerol-3-phosphate dehydrogenase
VLDVETGKAIEVRARVVVNATGPWSDSVERLAHPGSVSALRGSKGVHVSVPRSRIGNTAALTLTAPQDGRVMFVLPSGAFTIIGTTDTFDDVAPEDVRANERDVTYLLDSANHYFPDAALTRSDVVSAWAGLRPLAVAAGGGSSASAASREHDISEVEPGMVRVTGGKLTTYRSMASQVVDAVQRSLGGSRTKSRTAREPLVGGDVADVAREIAEATRVIEDGVVAERLVHAYGSVWRSVWALVHDDDMLRTRIAPERPYLLAELKYAVDHELARTFGDLLIRRTPVAFETQDHGRNAARRIAPSVALWLGWDTVAVERALIAYDQEVARMFTIDSAD